MDHWLKYKWPAMSPSLIPFLKVLFELCNRKMLKNSVMKLYSPLPVTPHQRELECVCSQYLV